MDTLLIASLIVGAGTVLAFAIFAKSSKPGPSNRPNINIDFDTAKEREDKNRYFS